MQLLFYKYQGTGNDFVIIDNRSGAFDRGNNELVRRLCDRRLGIGADGLMLLNSASGYDFEMIYYNADGMEGSMCGNGGRCMVAFAKKIGVLEKEETHFIAVDGVHEAIVKDDIISLKMGDVTEIELGDNYYYLNTGSPHYVTFVDGLMHFDVYEEGRKVRYNERFSSEGTNVNFLQLQGDTLFVRTYERGVENETLSCGTGVTASALVAAIAGKSTAEDQCKIKTLGGNLNVKFGRQGNNVFTNIWLEGPAELVFNGEITI